jgi:hypothetical protein
MTFLDHVNPSKAQLIQMQNYKNLLAGYYMLSIKTVKEKGLDAVYR